ncbi:YceD family protein [Sneathiella glossodoripedis]|uniref:YceD family protein n=1 Tax=Sneathiella glossodoripedis TaxID=418853 RepID=UPI0004728475|nr:DUF177 domain-containing protein [Sneathiella glossodoripedis]
MQDAGAAFVKWLKVDRVKREPLTFSFAADEQERSDLANRLGILELKSLEASGEIKRKGARDLLELTGRIKAEAVQACVVSLEPVPQEIEEEFSLCYTFNKEDTVLEEAEYVVNKNEEDLPELVEGGQIDLVLAVAEQIALALDPYPRAEGAELSGEMKKHLLEPEDEVEGETEEVYKPFANLKDLLNRK